MKILLGLLRFEHATRAAIRVDAVDERRSASTVGLTLRRDNQPARTGTARRPLSTGLAPDQRTSMSYILRICS